MGQFPPDYPIACGYFWNTQHGIVGGIDGIFYTTNGGTTWQTSAVPSFSAYITSIYMKDTLAGWASLATLQPGTTVLWQTMDGGVTWKNVPGYVSGGKQPDGNGDSDDPSGITDISIAPTTGALILTSWGLHFTFPPEDATSITWDSTGLGVIGGFGDCYVSSNRGKTWKMTGNDPGWAFGIFPSSNWHTFFEVSYVLPWGTIYTSKDQGATWDSVYATGQLMTGDAEGAPGVCYVQSSSNGIYRTTDTGNTWVNIGGPSNVEITRFCVLGCNGATVIAFDDTGGVWLTQDGGDGTLSKAIQTLLIDTFPSVSQCSQSRMGVKLNISNSCQNSFSLTGYHLEDDTTHFSLDSLLPFPKSYGGGDYTDSFYVSFNPQTQPGTFTTKLHVTGTVFLSDSSFSYDTVILITATSTPSRPNIIASDSLLAFGAISTCNGTALASVTFKNGGCAPDTITNFTLSGTGFTGPNDTLPIIVLAGDSVKLEYRFVPPDSGVFTGQAQLNVVSMGLTENPVIDLSGQGVQGLGVLDVRSMGLQAGSFSFCTGDTTLTDTISNTGCDTLVISNIRFAGGSAFSLLSVSGDSLLLPGASRVFQFHFVPRTKGAQSATLTFHSQNIVNDAGHDTTITLAGIGLGGTKILTADTSLRDFGGLYACQSRDTTIVLSNPGCDTLRIDSGTVNNGTYSTNAIYPIILPPDSSVSVTIHLTADSAGMNGTLTFFSDANKGDSVVTIPLTASIIPPAHLVLALSPSDTATDGTLVKCYVLLEGQVPPGAISGMQFDITHNDDLLSFLNASGVTMTGTAGTPEAQVLHFAAGSQAGSPTYADTIGTITFRVYLSDSIFTPLSLSNVTFTNSLSLSDDCVASILDSGASFTYLYRCGEPIIQDAMENVTPFSIESIVPNPAGDEITIELSGSAQPVIEMYDALGRSVLTTPQPPPSIGVGVVLDVSEVPSGIYYLRFSSEGCVQTRRISVAR